MKIILEINNNDLVNARGNALAELMKAAQEIAASGTEPISAENEVGESIPVVSTQPEAKTPAESAQDSAGETKKTKATNSVGKGKKAAQKAAEKVSEPVKEPEPEEDEPETAEAEPDQETEKEEPAAEPEAKKEAAPVDRKAISQRLKEIANDGHTKEIKQILQDHGITKLKDCPDDVLQEILEEAEDIA